MRLVVIMALGLAGCATPKPAPPPAPPEVDCGLGAHSRNGRCEPIDPPCRPGETLMAGKGCVGPEPVASAVPAPGRKTRQIAPDLQIEDLVEGKGTPIRTPARVSVHYVGSLPGGEVFDDSHPRGPFRFDLGRKHVIPGWELGLEGMRVGGVRRLTIGPGLAYGERGAPPKIPPNATLEFVIELLSID